MNPSAWWEREAQRPVFSPSQSLQEPDVPAWVRYPVAALLLSGFALGDSIPALPALMVYWLILLCLPRTQNISMAGEVSLTMALAFAVGWFFPHQIPNAPLYLCIAPFLARSLAHGQWTRLMFSLISLCVFFATMGLMTARGGETLGPTVSVIALAIWVLLTPVMRHLVYYGSRPSVAWGRYVVAWALLGLAATVAWFVPHVVQLTQHGEGEGSPSYAGGDMNLNEQNLDGSQSARVAFIVDSLTLWHADRDANNRLQEPGYHKLSVAEIKTQMAHQYWRGNVLYFLNGTQWHRPNTNVGYNVPSTQTPQFYGSRHPSLVYDVTWAGSTHDAVFLDRPGSDLVEDLPDARTGKVVPMTLANNPRAYLKQFTDDGISMATVLRQRLLSGNSTPEEQAFFLHPSAHPQETSEALQQSRMYTGVAALTGEHADSVAYTNSADQAIFLAWARNEHPMPDNPQTRAQARALAQAHPGRAFISAWLDWLNARSVYDIHRTAQNAGANPADAFLFSTGQDPAHGTCVDFATSTVLALREADIPARLVTGYVGGQWSDRLNAWVVTSSDAHAWVEYYDTDAQHWQRLDPTTFITRKVETPPALSAWREWMTSWSPLMHGTLPGPDARKTLQAQHPRLTAIMNFFKNNPLMIISVVGFLMFLASLSAARVQQWWQFWRLTPRERQEWRLQDAVEAASARIGKRDAHAARQEHEGLVAWVQRAGLAAQSEDWRTLANDTQAFWYRPQSDGTQVPTLLRRWRRMSRAWRPVAEPNGAAVRAP